MASLSQRAHRDGLVIGIAGRIGAGKTTLGRWLESESNFQYLRYSLVLAEWFQTEPDAKTRLQEIGWDVMSGDSQLELNQRLIGRIDGHRDCAVDGLRHPIDFESLMSKFGSRFFLIYIDTPPELRFDRLRARYPTHEAFLKADSHPVEAKIESLKPLAAATLSGALSRQQFFAEAKGLIGDFRSQGNRKISQT